MNFVSDRRFNKSVGKLSKLKLRTAYIACILLLLSWVTRSQTLQQNNGQFYFSKENSNSFVAKEIIPENVRALYSRFHKFRLFTFPAVSINAAVKSADGKINIGIQLSHELGFNIQIAPSEIIPNTFKQTIQTQQGLKEISSRINYLYKGFVTDKDGGEVRLTIKDGFLYGSIKKGEKEYFIEPLSRYVADAANDQYILYETTEVVNEVMSCGFNDVNNTMKRVAAEQNDATLNGRVQGSLCKKIKFLIASDYSMYKAFKKNIDSLETFLLSNLNMAEGVFNTLNLGADGLTDVGADNLNFEVTQMHYSICDSCDFVGNTDRAGDVSQSFAKWLAINTNANGNDALINQFWTTRTLALNTGLNIGGYATIASISPCFKWMNLIKYASDNLLMLRLKVAHEAGHALGCQHDNEISPAVTGFFMNASANVSATRFSRLSDFGGINYSSLLAMRNYINASTCIGDCSPVQCDKVDGLKLDYFNSADSVRLSWKGTGIFGVTLKIKDSILYDPAQVYTIYQNEIVLKNLSPCTIYTVEVQKICSNNQPGSVTSITFNSSPFTVTTAAFNTRGNLYDLKLQLECKSCSPKEVLIKIDHKPYYFQVSHFPSTVIVPDLFADGARHRVDYNGDRMHNGCSILKFYNAPYYRANSHKIIEENFNNCKIPAGWKDTIFQSLNSGVPNGWATGKLARDFSSLDDIYFVQGDFDSTCMLFNLEFNGSHALVSPAVDISLYKNIYLGFDYRYISYKYTAFQNRANSFFKIEVFDGNNWTSVFELNKQELFSSSLLRRRIWDTIPARQFIKLDEYRNDKFQIRFVVNNGAVINPASGAIEFARPFTYLDNIKLDGYDSTFHDIENTFSIFPNPTLDELFIQIGPLTALNLQYKICDVSGRTVQKGKLENYRINGVRLSKGIYFLTFFKIGKQIGKTIKFLKQ